MTKTVLITGASSGIGLATAKLLAKEGYRLILVVRPGTQFPADSWPKDTRIEACDLARPALVQALAGRLVQDGVQIDVLFSNAAVQPWVREETPEGLELGFATGVLATYVLIRGLQPLLERTAPSTIIVTGSLVYQWGSYDLSDLQRLRHFDPNASYYGVKLCQMQLVSYFAEALKPMGIAVHSLEPGMTRTAFARHFKGFFWFMSIVWRLFMRDPSAVAAEVLDLIARGDGIDKSGTNWVKGKERPLSAAASNREAQRALVSAIEEILATVVPQRRGL